jgi:hypothetical protein
VSGELTPPAGDGSIPGAAEIDELELADRAATLLLAAESPNTSRSQRSRRPSSPIFSAIAAVHRAAGHESPTDEASVVRWKRGMRRTHGKAADQKHPFPDRRYVAATKAMPSTTGRHSGCHDPRARARLGPAALQSRCADDDDDSEEDQD